MINPVRVLREAIHAIPAVKYALGVAGIASAVAIIVALRVDLRIAGFGSILMILLMVLLVIFAHLAVAARHIFYRPMVFLVWSVTLIVVSIAVLLCSSIFFRIPIDLQYWIKTGKPAGTSVEPPLRDTSQAVKPSPSPSSDLKSISESQSSMAELATAAEEQEDKVARLRRKGPPFGYRLSENCTVVWTNYLGNRIWAKNPEGLLCGNACPIEPLGIYIQEDSEHYYEQGEIKGRSSKDPLPEGCFPPVNGLCAADPVIVKVGQLVRFQAAGFGGNGYYSYDWLDERGNRSTEHSFTTSFKKEGVNVVKVQIFSYHQSVFKECQVLVLPP